jgi:hypothetical protein
MRDADGHWREAMQMITGAHYRLILLMCLLLLGIVSCGEIHPAVTVRAALTYLNLNDSFFLTQSDAGGVNEAGDQFGADAFTGDFNGDGFVDLAVGAPLKGNGSGVVYVFFGSEAGITLGGIPITQADAGEVGETDDHFGAALVSGDFNGDKIDDLVVGAPGKALGGGPKSGAVFIFFGSRGGFLPGFVVSQNITDQVNEAGDQFGAALATGDLNGDASDELVVGSPGKGPDGGPRSGAVFIFSAATTTTFADFDMIDPTNAGQVNEDGDRFGASLESGHFNGSLGIDIGDGFGDLAVGAPGKRPDGGPRSGAVFVFLGSKVGFTPGFSITQTDALGSAGCNPAVRGSCRPEVNEEGDEFGAAMAAGDLNGDGAEELIVGAPGEAVDLGPRSGLVFIFPGSPTLSKGLTTGYYITQSHAGQVNLEGDRFGAALFAGVLNEDEFEELVVGAPGKNLDSGAVFVFPGAKAGTGITRGSIITAADAGGVNQAGDRFGATLAIEDFNDNNGADVAVAGYFGNGKSGAVFVFPGVPTSPPAFTEENNCTKVDGIPVRPCEENEAGDQFGSASATGDFNGDGFADLALGALGKAPGGDPTSGAVFIFPGSVSGNGITTGFFITQNHAGQANQAGDQFGTAVAAGDFNGDGIEDLAVGAPGKAPGGGPRSGAVFIFPGSVNGLTCLAGVPCPTTIITGFFITQTDAGGVNEEGDRFGAALTVGDFNGDGIEDLAVGAPGKAPGGGPRSGAVFVFSGSKTVRIGRIPGSSITQTDAIGSAGCDPAVPGSCIPAVNEAGDLFGAALASGDIVGDVYQELIVGAPGDALAAGIVFVFPGSDTGLTPGFYITQADTLGSASCMTSTPTVSCIPGVSEAGDQFGAALAVGDFDGDRLKDLVVGAPGDAPGAAPGAAKSGSVYIFPGTDTGIIPGVYITHADQTDPEDILPNEAGDRFGAALAVGEFNVDLFDELIVGASGKAPSLTDPKSGTVCVFPGSATGITTGVFFSQVGRGGAEEAGDQFGAALAVGDYNGDRLDDVFVGAPGEALGADPQSGAVFAAPWGDMNFILL